MDNKVTVLQIKKPELGKVPHLTQSFSSSTQTQEGKGGTYTVSLKTQTSFIHIIE